MFVEIENLIYNDILFEDILEIYENFFLKFIVILYWVMENCEGVRYLLKIDDDMFFNFLRFLNELNVYLKINIIFGCKVSGVFLFWFVFLKWKILRLEYKNDYYLDYIVGIVYLISGDIILNLYWVIWNVLYFIFEDVYIIGLCRKYIGVVVLENKGFNCGYWNCGFCGNNFRY